MRDRKPRQNTTPAVGAPAPMKQPRQTQHPIPCEDNYSRGGSRAGDPSSSTYNVQAARSHSNNNNRDLSDWNFWDQHEAGKVARLSRQSDEATPWRFWGPGKKVHSHADRNQGWKSSHIPGQGPADRYQGWKSSNAGPGRKGKHSKQEPKAKPPKPPALPNIVGASEPLGAAARLNGLSSPMGLRREYPRMTDDSFQAALALQPLPSSIDSAQHCLQKLELVSRVPGVAEDAGGAPEQLGHIEETEEQEDAQEEQEDEEEEEEDEEEEEEDELKESYAEENEEQKEEKDQKFCADEDDDEGRQHYEESKQLPEAHACSGRHESFQDAQSMETPEARLLRFQCAIGSCIEELYCEGHRPKLPEVLKRLRSDGGWTPREVSSVAVVCARLPEVYRLAAPRAGHPAMILLRRTPTWFKDICCDDQDLSDAEGEEPGRQDEGAAATAQNDEVWQDTGSLGARQHEKGDQNPQSATVNGTSNGTSSNGSNEPSQRQTALPTSAAACPWFSLSATLPFLWEALRLALASCPHPAFLGSFEDLVAALVKRGLPQALWSLPRGHFRRLLKAAFRTQPRVPECSLKSSGIENPAGRGPHPEQVPSPAGTSLPAGTPNRAETRNSTASTTTTKMSSFWRNWSVGFGENWLEYDPLNGSRMLISPAVQEKPMAVYLLEALDRRGGLGEELSSESLELVSSLHSCLESFYEEQLPPRFGAIREHLFQLGWSPAQVQQMPFLAAQRLDLFKLEGPCEQEPLSIYLRTPPPSFRGWVCLEAPDPFPKSLWQALRTNLRSPASSSKLLDLLVDGFDGAGAAKRMREWGLPCLQGYSLGELQDVLRRAVVEKGIVEILGNDVVLVG